MFVLTESIICLLFASVAQKLLDIGSIQFGDSVLSVISPPISAENESDSCNRKVEVSGIPEKMSTSLLRAFLESPKVCGGEIEDIVHETGSDVATVTFRDIEGN